MNEITQGLKTFVIDNFLYQQIDGGLTEDTSFLESGIIDSTGLLELIGFVERTYNIRMKDEELMPDNLDSLRNLTRFIERKVANRVVEQTA